MSISRWIDELLHPAKACERKGHNLRQWTERVYLYPPLYSFSHVADTAKETHGRCARCGHREPVVTARIGGLNGLSMSPERWDQLRENGRLA